MLPIAAANQSACFNFSTANYSLKLQCTESDNFTEHYIIELLSLSYPPCLGVGRGSCKVTFKPWLLILCTFSLQEIMVLALPPLLISHPTPRVLPPTPFLVEVEPTSIPQVSPGLRSCLHGVFFTQHTAFAGPRVQQKDSI